MTTRPLAQSSFFRLRLARSASPVRTGSAYLDWYQAIVLGIALAVIYTNLPIYAYARNSALLPKYLFFMLFLLMAPLLLARQQALGAYLRSPFFLWAMALVGLNLIHFANWSVGAEVGKVYLVDNLAQARAALILTRVQYILFASLFGFVVAATPRKSYLYTAAVVTVLLSCAVCVDFVSPGIFYPIDTSGAVLGRAAATFINPTMAGEAVLHVFLLACAVMPLKYRGPLFLLAGVAVLLTFSRSSIIGWTLILLILIFYKSLPRSVGVATVAALVAAVVLLGSFETYLGAREGFEAASDNIVSRLEFFSSFNLQDDSSEERASVARAAWELFLQDPVFGAGAGATLFWSHRGSTHNQLLLFAAEYGIIGVGFWLWLLVILWKGRFFEDKGIRLAMVFLFAFMSMFTHQMLDGSTYWLTTFAIVSANALRPNGSERRQGQRRYAALPRAGSPAKPSLKPN